jgi:hypothetical protein
MLRVNALTLIHGKLKNLDDCSENSMKVFSFVSCFRSIEGMGIVWTLSE